MIQDQLERELWAAVDELRRRVEEAEKSKKESVQLPAYVSSATSNRKTFHRRDCKFARRFDALDGRLQEFSSHAAAVEAGLVPCKVCGV